MPSSGAVSWRHSRSVGIRPHVQPHHCLCPDRRDRGGTWPVGRAGLVRPRSPQAARPALKAARLFDPPRELPAFSLRQSDGTPLVPGELKGHWTLVFLGFTHCPDVCPTTLARTGAVRRSSGPRCRKRRRPRVLFVSVDPERDTPDAIGEYAHAFHRDTLAATADVPALETFAKSLSMVFAKVPAHRWRSRRPVHDGSQRLAGGARSAGPTDQGVRSTSAACAARKTRSPPTC